MATRSLDLKTGLNSSMSAEALSTALQDVARAFRPPPVMRYSEWAEQNFRLPAESSAVSGRYKPWKYQRRILDAIGDPTIERVTLVKPTRIGFTKMLVAALAADAANDPCPVILLVPTDDDARGMMTDEVDPAFRDTPAVRGLMGGGRSGARERLTQRSFLGGGSLKALAARAPRNLRRHTARKLYCDEVDGMEITKEGDPLKLATKRTESYADRKIVFGSTPVDEATSVVWNSYQTSDMRVFEVPCPHCGHLFVLEWEHIKWADGKPATAHAVCPASGCVIEERHKPAMVEAGDFRITAPEVDGHAGFHVSALVSLQPQAAWGKLAAEYVTARKEGATAMQVFTNTVLALPWSTTIDSIDETSLMARREGFALQWDEVEQRWDERIPPEVLYITAGIDVQVDRIEIGLWGWSRSERWALGHEVIRGATNLTSTWDEVDNVLMTTWTHPLGGRIGIEAAGIDSGDGNRTQFVYDFCGPRRVRKVLPIKGREGAIPVLKATTSRRARRAGAQLHIVGVDQVKMDLISSTQVEPGNPGSLRFSECLTEEWFIQFTSERRKVDLKNGRLVTKFVRIGMRQGEALDCAVYGIAIRQICRFEFDRREEELTLAAPKKIDPNEALKAALKRKRW